MKKRAGRRSALTFTIVVAGMFVGGPSASATAACPADSLHQWGHQWASNTSWGQSGKFYTYNVSVPDPDQAFSLSHVYMYLNLDNLSDSLPANGTTFLEDGYYKGLGKINTSSPKYYRTFQDGSGYHEGDDSNGPTIGGIYQYDIYYSGHNYTLKADDWTYYYGNPISSIDTVHIKTLPYARPLSGGEVRGDSTSYTQMETHGEPNQAIEGRDSTLRNWTTFFSSTQNCESANVTFTVASAYMNFSANGSI